MMGVSRGRGRGRLEAEGHAPFVSHAPWVVLGHRRVGVGLVVVLEGVHLGLAAVAAVAVVVARVVMVSVVGRVTSAVGHVLLVARAVTSLTVADAAAVVAVAGAGVVVVVAVVERVAWSVVLEVHGRRSAGGPARLALLHVYKTWLWDGGYPVSTVCLSASNSLHCRVKGHHSVCVV